MANSVAQIKNFLSIPEKPVSASEMMEFWKACSAEEKAEFQNADLS